ncbi:MAG: hypothetical protein HP493_14805 [Nitrospira sp.]|nr:hypothetical protein [Nitrospira sp.]
MRGMALRGKLLAALGVALIALALFVNWAPPSEPSLPETKSFLLFLGATVIMAGVIVVLLREP